MLEKVDFAGVIKLLDEVMILSVTIIGLLAITGVRFRLFSDLTISLIHVIAQQIQKIRACIVAWRKLLQLKRD